VYLQIDLDAIYHLNPELFVQKVAEPLKPKVCYQLFTTGDTQFICSSQYLYEVVDLFACEMS